MYSDDSYYTLVSPAALARLLRFDPQKSMLRSLAKVAGLTGV